MSTVPSNSSVNRNAYPYILSPAAYSCLCRRRYIFSEEMGEGAGLMAKLSAPSVIATDGMGTKLIRNGTKSQ